MTMNMNINVQLRVVPGVPILKINNMDFIQKQIQIVIIVNINVVKMKIVVQLNAIPLILINIAPGGKLVLALQKIQMLTIILVEK